MLTVIAAGTGSPGATTLALGMALTWQTPVLLVEADPSGGSIRYGYGQGADMGGRGLLGWRIGARRTDPVEAVWANTVQLAGGCQVLPGLDAPVQASSIDYALLARVVASLDVDVIVDVGRIPGLVDIGPLMAVADRVVIPLRSTLASVHAAQSAAVTVGRILGRGEADGDDDRLVSVLVGAGRPYPEGDVRAAMAQTAALADTVAWEPIAAGVLSDGAPSPRRFESTPLIRSLRHLAGTLAARHEPASERAKALIPQDVSTSAGSVARDGFGHADRTPTGGLHRHGEPVPAGGVR
jgi:hypothetical protein